MTTAIAGSDIPFDIVPAEYRARISAVAEKYQVGPIGVLDMVLPVDSHRMSLSERGVRAEVMWLLYGGFDHKGQTFAPLSLAEVGRACGGLSKQRVSQILKDAGFDVRPHPGSRQWRLDRWQNQNPI